MIKINGTITDRIPKPGSVIVAKPGVGIVVEIDGMKAPVLDRLIIQGGQTGIRLTDCPHATVMGCSVTNYRSAGPDNEGHGVQLIRCDDSMVRDNAIGRRPGSEDAINIYQSGSVKVRRNHIIGHGDDAGNAITFDKGSHDCLARLNTIDVMGGKRCIVVADGSGHVVEGNELAGWTDAAIAVEVFDDYEGMGKNTIGENTYGNGMGWAVWNDARAVRTVFKFDTKGLRVERSGK